MDERKVYGLARAQLGRPTCTRVHTYARYVRVHMIPRYGTALRSAFPNSVDPSLVCGTRTGYVFMNLPVFRSFFKPYIGLTTLYKTTTSCTGNF